MTLPIVLNFDLAAERLRAANAQFTAFITDVEVPSGDVVSIRADGEIRKTNGVVTDPDGDSLLVSTYE